jgi:hypothetical protein
VGELRALSSSTVLHSVQRPGEEQALQSGSVQRTHLPPWTAHPSSQALQAPVLVHRVQRSVRALQGAHAPLRRNDSGPTHLMHCPCWLHSVQPCPRLCLTHCSTGSGWQAAGSGSCGVYAAEGASCAAQAQQHTCSTE